MDGDDRGGESSPEISFLIFDDNPNTPNSTQDSNLAQKFWKQFELEPQIESNLVATDKISQSSRHNSFINKENSRKIRSTPMRHRSSAGNTSHSSNSRTDTPSNLRPLSGETFSPADVITENFESISFDPNVNEVFRGTGTGTRTASKASKGPRNLPTKNKSKPNPSNTRENEISEMVKQLKKTNLKLNKKPVLGNIKKKNTLVNELESSGNQMVVDPLSCNTFEEEFEEEDIAKEMAALDVFEQKQGLRA